MEDPQRDAIVDAAERCFETIGVAKTTMLQVASEAGISRTTLYKRFAAIHDVLQAVFVREFDRFEDRLRPALDPLKDPASRLVEIVVAISENAPDNAGIARLVGGPMTRAEARALAVGRAALNRRVEAMIDEPLDSLAADGRLVSPLPRTELQEWIRRIVTALVQAPQPTRRNAAARRSHVAALILPLLCGPAPTEAPTHA
ncbi:MAG: TetR/AcrR family transcriptional regulator [Acidimicrobiales bacterium]|jgi:AcrR family transcriptional regulator|nr:TetR/AcrR family transcriptional regulator [Acidimicrobiales bacterium]